MTVAGMGGGATPRAEACCPWGPSTTQVDDEPETLTGSLAHVARIGGGAKPEPEPAA